MPQVVALGDINVDVIAHYLTFPIQGQDAFASATSFHCGGAAANTATALSGLGVETRLIARIGPDPSASLALRWLSEAGVGLGGLQRDPQVMTGSMYIVVTPDGERTILGHRGANAFTDPRLLCEDAFEDAHLFYLSGYALLTEPQRSAALLALELACRHGLTVALDPGLAGDPAVAERTLSQLPAIDIFLPNLAEARALTHLNVPDDCAQALVASGARLVALKLGLDGCLISDGLNTFHVPGFSVQARDSTGAGDSFAAGLLAAHLAGLDWPAAGLVANAMGALTATRIGAGGSVPAADDLLALLTQPSLDPAERTDQESLDQAIDFVKALVA